MDGTHEAAAAPRTLSEVGRSSPFSPMSSSSTLTEFSPEHHSWILVPDHALEAAAQAVAAAAVVAGAESSPALNEVGTARELDESGMGQPAKQGDDGAVGGNAPAKPHPLDDHTGPVEGSVRSEGSPALGASILQEGEAIAALAVSEILSNEWPTTSHTTPSASAPFVSSADAANLPPPPPSLGVSLARRLGALAFPTTLGGAKEGKGAGERPACAGGDYFGNVPDDAYSEAGDDGLDLLGLLFPPSAWGGSWSRPLAIAAVLLASHAAALMVGIAIGRQLQLCSSAHSSAAAASAQDVYLTRRFSSGASGQHARLCMT